MATKSVYGYVSADRNIISGSGDFTVGQKVSDGVYDIVFKTPFNDIPAVTANCQEDQTNRGISIHVSQIRNEQAQLAVMNTYNQTPYDIAFLFIAMGPVDD